MKKNIFLIFFLCTYFLTHAQTVSITSSATGAICAGTSVTFTATPTAITSPTYQWYKNGTAISGETNITYATSSLSDNDQISVKATPGYTVGSISTTGLIANFDAANYNTTSTRWNDQSSSSNHMDFYTDRTYSTLKTATYSTDGGGSLNVNNNSVFGKTMSNTGITGNGGKTMSAWVKIDATDVDWASVASIGEYAAAKVFEIYAERNGTTYSQLIFHWSGGQVKANPNLAKNTWYYVTIKSDGSNNNYIYINGVQEGYSIQALNITNSPLYMGAPKTYSQGGWNDNFRGKISTLSLYNTALTNQTILDNYNATKGRYTSTSITSNTITSSITAGPSIPTITVTGDACINKTTLSAVSGLSSYAWLKDNVAISGATTTNYSPTAAGDYKVVVSNGTCSTASAATTINTCGVTADGKMVSVAISGSLLSLEGGANFGTGIDNLGKILNTTGLTTTSGRIAATTAVLGGIISATNAVTSSIGLVYSTDANFGTYSSTTIQSNVLAGAYTSTISGLSSSTNYYAKSFVVNKAGTSYGPIVSFTTPAAYIAPVITTTGLVLNLDAAHPDSYSGYGTTWTDVSGKNNSVTLPSVLASSYSATIGGGSFTFNNNNLGTTNTISSTAITDWNINTTEAISVEAWINYTSNGGLQFYFVDGGLNYRFGFDQDGHFYYDLGCHCDRNPTNGYSLTAGSWHHVVFTAGIEAGNGNRVMTRIYIDGSQVHSNDEGMTTLPNITTPYKIGDDYPDFLLKAKLGLIRVYNKALTTSDISLNFNAQKTRFGF